MDKIIHHYLHEQAAGTVNTKRTDSNSLICTFGDAEYHLSVNERDQRSLVAFDGELLFGGLPRSATVVQSVSIENISCPSDTMRKNPEYWCEAFPRYSRGEKKTSLNIFRHFLLLPSCTAIVRKFRNKSLSPIYVVIKVFYNDHGTRVVEWLTTSY